MLGRESRPIRAALRWQALATGVAVLLAAWLAGKHGALSAAFGGAVTMAASLVFAAVAQLGKPRSGPGTAGSFMLRALRAEAARIGAIVVLLWAVFTTYESLVAVAFIATFAVTVMISSMAFFARNF